MLHFAGSEERIRGNWFFRGLLFLSPFSFWYLLLHFLFLSPPLFFFPFPPGLFGIRCWRKWKIRARKKSGIWNRNFTFLNLRCLVAGFYYFNILELFSTGVLGVMSVLKKLDLKKPISSFYDFGTRMEFHPFHLFTTLVLGHVGSGHVVGVKQSDATILGVMSDHITSLV